MADASAQAPVHGVVERLEKFIDGELLVWSFVVSPAGGSRSVVFELRGEQIHGALRDGDEVHVAEVFPQRGTDSLTARRVENQTLGTHLTVHRRSTLRRYAAEYGKVAATTVVTGATSSLVTVLLTGGSDEASEAPAPAPQQTTTQPPPGNGGDQGPPVQEPPVSTGARGDSDVLQLAALALFEFGALWLVWYGVWGRRWRRSTRLWTTAGIAAAVLVVFGVGVAS